MNWLIKVGLFFMVLAPLSFLGVMWAVLNFGVGAASNPPLTGWFASLVKAVMIFGAFWYVWLIVGLVLIVLGFLQRQKVAEKPSRKEFLPSGYEKSDL